MKNNSIYIIIIACLFLLTACEKAVIGIDEVNDPENNFELLWNDFNDHYSLFMIRDIDWGEQYSIFRPQVTPQTTDAELWNIMTEMIEVLDDGHTFLANINDNREDYYISGNALNTKAEEEFDLGVVENKYLDNLTDLSRDKEFSYGKVKGKNVGYIYLGSMSDTDPAQIDDVIKDLKDYPAIIIDIRNNGGGYDSFSARIAGAFADKEELIYTVQNRNGPNHNDFEAPREYYTQKIGDEQYTKPVILLTDRYTISAGEIFLLHMNAFDHVVQMGDYTAGDFSDGSARRFLPNGWFYRYSIQMFLQPDGTSLDGVGHKPDVFVKNTKADIAAGNDVVMEKAFDYLLEEYDIQ